MASKLTRLTHKIAIQLHLMAAAPLTVLAPSSQSGNFWIRPRICNVYGNQPCEVVSNTRRC